MDRYNVKHNIQVNIKKTTPSKKWWLMPLNYMIWWEWGKNIIVIWKEKPCINKSNQTKPVNNANREDPYQCCVTVLRSVTCGKHCLGIFLKPRIKEALRNQCKITKVQWHMSIKKQDKKKVPTWTSHVNLKHTQPNK